MELWPSITVCSMFCGVVCHGIVAINDGVLNVLWSSVSWNYGHR